MKRSEGKTIQIQHSDWLMAKDGIKTCTSRYGDRTSEYSIGEVFNFVDNDTDETLKILIEEVKLKTLKGVTSQEALAIGNYTWADHVADFYGIYGLKLGRKVDENTVLSLIYFKVI